ncbi:hypothetical protein M3Y98_00585300 [Aphelenchoides besseyi]|nr:hypothetical protein M3Y98_00585300 [Aphelenchoides besseyi]
MVVNRFLPYAVNSRCSCAIDQSKRIVRLSSSGFQTNVFFFLSKMLENGLNDKLQDEQKHHEGHSYTAVHTLSKEQDEMVDLRDYPTRTQVPSFYTTQSKR